MSKEEEEEKKRPASFEGMPQKPVSRAEKRPKECCMTGRVGRVRVCFDVRGFVGTIDETLPLGKAAFDLRVDAAGHQQVRHDHAGE